MLESKAKSNERLKKATKHTQSESAKKQSRTVAKRQTKA